MRSGVRRRRIGPLLAAGGLLGGACGGPPDAGGMQAGPATRARTRPADPGPAIARRIEAAHGLAAWRAGGAVAFDLDVQMGGRTLLDGSVLFDHGGGRVRMDLREGVVLVFDGRRAWVSPSRAEAPMARFHLLTWTYFLAAPFKLRDPGTHLERVGPLPLHGVAHEAARLTFEPGVGDTPEDWYAIYEAPDTHRLAAMGYIVTYGKSVEEARQEPHSIVYHDYETVGGAVLSTRWTLHHWSMEEGPHGEPLGEVTVTGLRFVDPDDGAFAPPADAREDPLPGGGGPA